MPLSDYLRIQQVGSGGFADAYLVEPKSDRTKKLVMKEMSFTCGDERRDCQAEVDLLRQLNHPNIVAFHESFSTHNAIFLVMEYCSGGDLAKHLKAQHHYLDEQRILGWALQILEALQYLHGRPKPVLHRDMKPANIFLTENRRSVKIGDFGVSRELAHFKDLATTVCGTPLYLAPEIFRQESYDHKCDIWSLGCCVYEMMALKPAINPLLLATLNMVSINPMPTNYSQELVDIVLQMLSVQASARPSATEAIVQVNGLLWPQHDPPVPGSSSAAMPDSPQHSSPYAGATGYDDDLGLPVDSMILNKARLQQGNNGAAAAAAADQGLEDEYDIIIDNDLDETVKEVDTVKKDETVKNYAAPIKTPAWSLRQHGYRFNKDGQLVDASGGKFKYDYYPRDSSRNEKRYQEVAKAVTEYVYERLEKELGMYRIHLPLDYKAGEPWTFVYVTPDIFSNMDKLLILIGGAGPIRAGIWSRKAVINDSIDAGSQIPLIREATRNGYAVLLLNQNQTFLEVGGLKVKIRGNHDELHHTLYVWDKLIVCNTRVKHIAIMAHSEGAEITAKLATERKDGFMLMVFAVALCHPRKDDLLHGAPKDVVNLFTTNSRTWVASKKPLDTPLKKLFTIGKDKNVELSAGDDRPEWTAFTSMSPAFEFIQQQYEKRVSD